MSIGGEESVNQSIPNQTIIVDIFVDDSKTGGLTWEQEDGRAE